MNISTLTNLEELSMLRIQMNDFRNYLPLFTELKYLNLSYMRIDGYDKTDLFWSISFLTKLEELHVNGRYNATWKWEFLDKNILTNLGELHFGGQTQHECYLDDRLENRRKPVNNYDRRQKLLRSHE